MPDARRPYHGRFDAVLDHVRSHLTEPLTVERLADVACFSTSHFHRVFTAMMGETVGAYVRRARLERAAQLMRASPRRSIGSVAMESGFASFSDFSRAFRRYFGVAPSRWDRRTSLEVSNNCQDDDDPRGDILRTWIDTDAGPPPVAELIELPSFTLAYVRVQSPSADGALARGCDTLRTWLRARRLPAAAAFDAVSRIRDDWVLIGTSWDDDVLTPPHLMRYDIACAVPSDTRAGDDVAVRTQPALLAVCARATGDLGRVARVWDFLYRDWLPGSRWEPYELPAFERYRRPPGADGWDRWDVDCCIPLVPLRLDNEPTRETA